MQLTAYKVAIDLIHKSQNALVPYPTMHQSEQKCAHFCSECSVVGYRTGAVCDLWIRSIAQVEHRPYSEFMRAWHWNILDITVAFFLGKPLVTFEFSSKGPQMQCFDILFVASFNKLLNK